MYVLKKILGIERQRTCFCGRSLVKNFCEIHGTDVKISMHIIHGQFEDIEEKNTKRTPINLSLTENQFINLFPKKDLENLTINYEEYNISISQIDSNNLESIIVFFFNQIESDNFFGTYRLKESQITNSNIKLNFLYSYEIISLQTIRVKFNLLVVRKLSDYIKWRLGHFQAKSENITNSLLRIRKNVYSDNGEFYYIKGIDWNPKEILPIKIIVENQNTQILENFPPEKLFQGQDDLQLNTKQENGIYSAFRNFSQQFMKSLKRYLVSQSCLATVEKANQSTTIFFEKLIGKNIKETINLIDYIKE